MAANPPVPPVPAADAAALVPPYVPVGGQNVVTVDLSEQDSLRQILYWCGFVNEAQINLLLDDGLESFSDVRVLTEKDISTMASSFSGRTATTGRFHFGTRRTKNLKALTHWVQDFSRVSQQPTVKGLNKVVFLSELERALARAEVRKSMKENTSTAASEASPGPLKSEREWKQWEEKFVNFLRLHVGANGVPLSYVIRENENPDHGMVHPDFVNQTIACTSLSGEFYAADRLSVFNHIVSFTTGQPSGDWVKDTLKYADGRRSMKALREHFSGEGNATRNISEADRLKESLHYKSERVMTFETFLTQMKKMFNIYEKEGEPMLDSAKVRFLYKSVQHPGLQAAFESLKTMQTTGTKRTPWQQITSLQRFHSYLSISVRIGTSPLSTLVKEMTIIQQVVAVQVFTMQMVQSSLVTFPILNPYL